MRSASAVSPLQKHLDRLLARLSDRGRLSTWFEHDVDLNFHRATHFVNSADTLSHTVWVSVARTNVDSVRYAMEKEA